VVTYLTNEASFEVEGPFTDHTVHWLEAPLDDGEKLRRRGARSARSREAGSTSASGGSPATA
jgi:hypothetical protein